MAFMSTYMGAASAIHTATKPARKAHARAADPSAARCIGRSTEGTIIATVMASHITANAAPSCAAGASASAIHDATISAATGARAPALSREAVTVADAMGRQ